MPLATCAIQKYLAGGNSGLLFQKWNPGWDQTSWSVRLMALRRQDPPGVCVNRTILWAAAGHCRSCLQRGVPLVPWAVLLGGAALVEDEEVRDVVPNVAVLVEVGHGGL